MSRYKEFEGNPDFVLSLARGLSVIEAFQDQPAGVTVTDVATKTGLSRAAVRRILVTLEMLGYATHTGSIFRLSTRVLRLGFSFLSSYSLAALASPVLEELSSKFHESCSLSVLEGDEIVYVARSATKRIMSVNLFLASRLPAYCTSMGRVLLAALPEPELESFLKRVSLNAFTPKTITTKTALRNEIEQVRKQGYALVEEELELGLRALAVPIVARTGQTVAAMNTGVHVSRVSSKELLGRFLPLLQQSATMIGQTLS